MKGCPCPGGRCLSLASCGWCASKDGADGALRHPAGFRPGSLQDRMRG